jgi:hypothetical protein
MSNSTVPTFVMSNFTFIFRGCMVIGWQWFSNADQSRVVQYLHNTLSKKISTSQNICTVICKLLNGLKAFMILQKSRSQEVLQCVCLLCLKLGDFASSHLCPGFHCKNACPDIPQVTM